LFEHLKPLPADAILKLIAEYNNDPRDEKIDLGVGVFRDESGATPILASVKKAEQRIVDEQDSKSYLGSGGDPVCNGALQALTFGDDLATSDRISTLHTPGGSGALRIAAGLLLRARGDANVWVSEPTWNNHVPLLGDAGLNLKAYPYYEMGTHRIQFSHMLDALNTIPAGDVLLLHGCCHNPTGMDLSHEQWQEVVNVVVARNLLPFIDIAYQGFAAGIEEDRFGVRLMYDAVPEMLVASSCSKNFGLYRDRIGSLSMVGRDAGQTAILQSQALQIVRTIYSVPPDHGSAIVSVILNDESLRGEWISEVAAMRERLQSMRSLLVSALHQTAPEHDFSHLEHANGLFSFLGVDEQQVERLKKEFGVYLVGSSRVNVAGITPGNVRYLAESIAAVL
jgi:aspartate aminotransferase